jgi:hypothetical protein
MSRMARALHREDVPNDYGASWTTLFLSPLLGAISAWFGIVVVMWLTEMEVLGEAFARITWDGQADAFLIAIAFVLGFSERLFTSLLSAVESKVDAGVTAGATNPPAASPGRNRELSPAAGAHGAATSGGVPVASRDDHVLNELDLTPGERVAFVGTGDTALRSKIAGIVGADHVVDAGPGDLASKQPFDAILFESSTGTPTIEALTIAAGEMPLALRPEGRVVVIGRSPAALFDADAETQRAQGHAGPVLAAELLATDASGLVGQEPPAVLGGTDPVEWSLTFVKPAAGGSDR